MRKTTTTRRGDETRDDDVGADAVVVGFFDDALANATTATAGDSPPDVPPSSSALAGTVDAARGEWSSFDESFYRKLRAMYDRAPGALIRARSRARWTVRRARRCTFAYARIWRRRLGRG